MRQPITRRSFLKGVGAGLAMLTMPGRLRTAQASAPTGPFPADLEWLDTLAGLGDNEWVRANPHDRLVYQPRACDGCGEAEFSKQILEPNPINRNSSSFVVGDGVVFNFGGGHNSHPGNDVDLYFVDANQWEDQYAPDVPVFGTREYKQVTTGANPSTIVNGRPWGGHTSQQMVYEPVGRRFVVVRKSGTWAYDTASQWTLLAGPSLGTFSPTWRTNSGVVLYDAWRHLIVAVSKAGARAVYELDPYVDIWGPKIKVPEEVFFPGGNIYGASNPDLREMYIFGYGTPGYRLYRYVPETHGWEPVTSLPIEMHRPSFFDYDSRNRRVVFIQGNPIGVWAWDPAADIWENLPQLGPRPTSKYGISNHCAYDPIHNVFIVLEKISNYCGLQDACGGHTETWMYRLQA